jgi:hypothetical protein
MHEFVQTGILVIIIAACIFAVHYIFTNQLAGCFKEFGIKNFTQYKKEILGNNYTGPNKANVTTRKLNATVFPIAGSGNLGSQLSLSQEFAGCFGLAGVPSANYPFLMNSLLGMAYVLLISGFILSPIGIYKTLTDKKKPKEEGNTDAKHD